MKWPVSKLDQLADSCLGKMLDKQKNRGIPRPYLRNINVRWGTFDLHDVQEMPFEADELERYSVRQGDLVVCEGGEPGRCAVWTQASPMFIQKALHRVRCGPDLAPTFLAYWLRHLAGSGKLAKQFTGTTIQHLPGVKLAALDVPHPPVSEQHRIVAAIETHFSRLDAAVASLTRAKANLKRARASVLKAAVEGRLVPTEAALARAEGRDFEPAAVLLDRILAERKAAWAASGARGKYAEPVKPEREGLPGLPEGWGWAVLGSIAHVERGGSPRPIDAFITADPDGLNWIKIGDTKKDSKYITSTQQKIRKEGLSKTRQVYPGDFLLTNSMSFGRPYITKIAGCIHDGWLRIHPPADLAKDYLYILLSSPFVIAQLKAAAAGAVVQNINIDKARGLDFPVPPIAEQHRIVAEVDRRLSVLDALDTTLDANLARCDRLRQAVLKRAFEGRLVPAEADAPPLAAAPQVPLLAQGARA